MVQASDILSGNKRKLSDKLIIDQKNPLRNGDFGVVFTGMYNNAIEVAVKRIQLVDINQRMKEDADLLKATNLEHDNIVKLHDVLEDDYFRYFIYLHITHTVKLRYITKLFYHFCLNVITYKNKFIYIKHNDSKNLNLKFADMDTKILLKYILPISLF